MDVELWLSSWCVFWWLCFQNEYTGVILWIFLWSDNFVLFTTKAGLSVISIYLQLIRLELQKTHISKDEYAETYILLTTELSLSLKKLLPWKSVNWENSMERALTLLFSDSLYPKIFGFDIGYRQTYNNKIVYSNVSSQLAVPKIELCKFFK